MEGITEVKAWTYSETGYPSTLKLSSTTIPATLPSATHITIKPYAVSLNPVDIQLMNLPMNSFPSFIPVLNAFTGPKIAGRDFSGEVVIAGPESGFQKGDKIMGINMATPGTGFLADAVVLDVKTGSGATVIKKPEGLDWIRAASLPCVWLTARTSIEKSLPFMPNKSNAKANKLVVLGGSSSTGIYTVKLAKLRGWTTLSSCSGRNVDFVKSLGADHVVDYTTSPNAVVDAVTSFKPDAIIDCVGGTETIGLAKQYVTIVGDKTSRATMGGSALYLTRPRMVLRWILGYLGISNSYECIILDSNRAYLEEIGTLNNDEVVIDSVFNFDKAKEAFERLDTGRARGKVVVKVAA